MMELQRALMVDDVHGRTLDGVAVTYGRSYRVSDDSGASFYREGWVQGAFAGSIKALRNAFELRIAHQDERLGMVRFDDTDTALAFTATLDESEAGDAALRAVTDGKLRSVSLRFRPRRHLPPDDDGVIWRNQADIRELSLAHQGQYEDAKVLAARNADTLATVRRMLIDCDRVLSYARTI